ncbi:class I adenylate-forming enzyme family protein [Sphingobium algorifonticola]|uniref:Long-chain fatty acid--CoA ligase n=1 Tax=Sphingobium algorifonticola TaxID=2008318 RepID=A0A437JA78_9SPHN|nr:AMP-binding protein [Sphingobium algorifonticola]RVT42270.1 hypothetical protein ENE74_08695 [Sphingobium algorifonticola]
MTGPLLHDVNGRPVWMPDTTLAPLDRAIAERPEAVAVRMGDIALNYADYGHAVAMLAADLVMRGAAGGTVAIILRNSIALAVAIFAAQRAGAACATLNPDYTLHELTPMLADAAPQLVLCHADRLTEMMAVAPAHAQVMPIPEDRTFLANLFARDMASLPAFPTIAPNTLAVLQFTGGTTGRAKGVELTHRAIATNIAQREAVLPTDFGDERILCFMPMFHSFAAAMCINLSAYASGTLVILPRYRPDWVIEAIAHHRITRLPAGPTVFNGLIAQDALTREGTQSLRSAWSGSAPLARETRERWEARTGVPVFEGYGQSEAGPILTYFGPGMIAKPGSVGPALPLTHLRIVDPADPSRICDTDEVGEITAQGPQIMRGYRGLAEETAATLRDGWLHTGDIGRIDADGHLFIEDRKKDMALVGGYNVFPREIDEVLMQHPSVAAAACVGVPDSYRGEAIVAFVTPRADRLADSAELADHCTRHLVRYKHPARYRMLPEMPLTPVGKIDKVALRALAIALDRQDADGA